MTSLFGTSGIRGPVDTFLTPQFCFDLGRTFAIFLSNHHQEGVVAIGRDTRVSSASIAGYIISGLYRENYGVADLGCVPVPAVLNSVLTTPAIAGIMVTGSHIDITSNGAKFFALNEEITKEHEAEISNIYFQIRETVLATPPATNVPLGQFGFDNYLELLLSLADQPLPRLKLVIDPGNGVQTPIMTQLMEILDQDAIFINNNLQDTLLSRDTEIDNSFIPLQETVLKHHADLGIGFDTDGDRIIFVDRHGKFISGDYSGTILAQWNSSNIIATPINTSSVIDSIGKEIVRTRVGSPFVIAAMKKYGSGFGFESNGGGIFADVMYSRDGGTSLIRMLNILKYSKLTLDTLISDLPHLHTMRSKFACPTEKNGLILEQSRKFLRAKSIDETDGLKIYLDHDTWVLFRPSKNSPEFRVFVESKSITKTKQILADCLKFAQQIANAETPA